MTRPSSSTHTVFRDFGVIFLSICAIYVALSICAPLTIWTLSEFDGVDRMLLAASELSLAALAAVFLALASMAFDRVRNTTHRGWMRTLPVSAVALYLISWLTLVSTGNFLSVQFMKYFLSSPWLIVLHVIDQQPGLAVIQVVVTVMVITGVVWVYAKQSWVRSRYWKVFLCIVPVLTLPATGIGQFWALHDAELIRTEQGLLQSKGSAFAAARAHATGPLLNGVAALIGAFTPEMKLANAKDVTVVHPMAVTLKQFTESNPIETRHNVLFILVESLRPDQLMAFGGRRSVMPNLDELATSSYRFSNSYTQATHSNYADLCPLSSQYPLRGINAYFYPETLPFPRVMIYDVLKRYGYRTAVISSQNESWMGMINFLRTKELDHLFHSETFDGETYSGDYYFKRWVVENNHSGKIDDRLTVDEVIRWTGEKTDVPFYVYVNLQNSHVPYRVPDDFPRPFGPKTIDFPLRFGFFPKEKAAVVKDRYADSLHYVDHQLGRIFDHLRKTGQFDDTIICVSGDTGQAFYEHGMCHHGGPVYDEVVRVPMILRIPGESGGDRDDVVQHVDVPPTILARLGVPAHPSFQGRDLFDDDTTGVAFLTSHSRTRQVGLVFGKYKLIFELGPRQTLLFDLENDPTESRDLSGKLPKVMTRMSGLLGLWYDQQLAYYRSPERLKREYPPRLILPKRSDP